MSTTISLSLDLSFSDQSPLQLTSCQHASQGSLLGARDGQIPVGLDLDPGSRVDAVEAGQRRLPRVGAPVSLGLVHVVRDGPQLRPDDVVGVLLALVRGPFVGSGLCHTS